MMRNIFIQNVYQTLNEIRISKKALLTNHQRLQSYQHDKAVCPVLKSNAYGHGLKTVAPVFDAMNCAFLVVDSLYEAYELHKLKVKTPILIIGYTKPVNFTVKRLPFDVAIFDLETASVLNSYQPGCHVHLFIDTGMNREGVQRRDLPAFLNEIKKLKNLEVTGLCSHFSDADSPGSMDYTEKQMKRFTEAYEVVRRYGFFPKWRHISASAGGYKIKDNISTMLRVGLAHYGINPLVRSDKYYTRISLKPALEFNTTLVQIKNVPKGEAIGYNCTYRTRKDSVVGLLPAGYYDGFDRRLSNKGVVKIRNAFFPVVGRISMNMTTVDITSLKHPKIGEKVTLYSSYKGDQNSVEHAAKTAGMIPHDMLVHLAESVRRVVV